MSENKAKSPKITELDETAVQMVSGAGGQTFLRGSLYQSLATNGTSYGLGNGMKDSMKVSDSQSGTTLCDIVSKTYFCESFTG